MEARKRIDIVKLLNPCDCQNCIGFLSQEYGPIVYRILDTPFMARKLVGITTYWKGCPRNIDAIPFLFEEIFEYVDEERKMILIFNLNKFKDL